MLHLPTVISLSVLLNILIGCFFVSAYNYKKQYSYLYFASACGVFVVAIILASSRLIFEAPLISHYFADLAIIASPQLIIAGIGKLTQQPHSHKLLQRALFIFAILILSPFYESQVSQMITSYIVGGSFLYLVYLTNKIRTKAILHRNLLSLCFFSHGALMMYQGLILSLNVINSQYQIDNNTLEAILISHLILATAGIFIIPFLLFAKDETELETFANQDSLTSLLNRRGFFNQGKKLQEHSAKFNQSLGVIMIDIDHFKTINDTYGHSIGDIAINWIAEHIINSCSTKDICGRIGGEEFAIIIANHTTEEAKAKSVQLLNNIRRAPMQCNGMQISLSVSVGVSLSLNSQQNIKELLKSADRRLYLAKNSGRDKVVTQDEKSLLNQV